MSHWSQNKPDRYQIYVKSLQVDPWGEPVRAFDNDGQGYERVDHFAYEGQYAHMVDSETGRVVYER